MTVKGFLYIDRRTEQEMKEIAKLVKENSGKISHEDLLKKRGYYSTTKTAEEISSIRQALSILSDTAIIYGVEDSQHRSFIKYNPQRVRALRSVTKHLLQKT